jgi:hypothetical protein
MSGRHGGTAAPFLTSSTKWRLVVSFTFRPLYPQGKSSHYPLHRKLGGPQNLPGCYGAEKISCSCQELNPGHQAHNPSLHQLLNPGSHSQLTPKHVYFCLTQLDTWPWYNNTLQKIKLSLCLTNKALHHEDICDRAVLILLYTFLTSVPDGGVCGHKSNPVPQMPSMSPTAIPLSYPSFDNTLIIIIKRWYSQLLSFILSFIS